MRATRVHLPAGAAPSWVDLRRELGIVDAFDPAIVAAAEAAAADPRLPELDRTDLELFSIDPAGSRDLDQAMALARRGDGFRVCYAIADVGAFVEPGSALDADSRERGETYYAPDERVPMLPPVLSEGAASLLPGEIRPAILWTIDIDGAGATTAIDVRRATVRSRKALAYGDDDPALAMLQTVGEVLLAGAARRGALSLPTPEQQVHLDASGRPTLTLRAPLPSERWNEQISLLTGRAAASLMLDGRIGLLRTLPAPTPDTVESLRRSALALGIDWPASADHRAVVGALDPEDGKAAALLDLVPRLLRGAAYTAFDGTPPADPQHSAVAAPYAHCTAPLRRLADRFVSEVCVALCARATVPEWARAALPQLPELMAAADHRAHALDRAATDLAEAIVLAPCVGERFSATVVEASDDNGVVQLAEPAVRAPCPGGELPLGERIEVRLAVADPTTRTVEFERA